MNRGGRRRKIRFKMFRQFSKRRGGERGFRRGEKEFMVRERIVGKRKENF